MACFPSQNPTVSYWMAHNTGPANRLAGYGREHALPMHTDVIIVGAGISGAAVAHFLINSDSPPDSVALVEARDVASGATGRNGGFIKPVPFLAYADYKKSYGTTAALQLVQSEYDNLQLTAELVEQGAIDADFTMRSHREIRDCRQFSTTLPPRFTKRDSTSSVPIEPRLVSHKQTA
ncbi:hypothetical protein BS47DRAFT_1339230 [Hydnum rufescens UP504]|uniref:FAD dependent oxidoreductase domain-containing protein n=1 Tax=Hydnum rufescens UP504 TaxID=1448309 RepID=A0A9P6B4R3_9AGAM|nr:hypothetical protein BS47DRAFT_1339230 [Hydnum rufescens UP504]